MTLGWLWSRQTQSRRRVSTTLGKTGHRSRCAFRVPAIKDFIHDEQAETIAKVVKRGRHRIVSRANGIASHRLQRAQAPLHQAIGYDEADRHEFAVFANPLEFEVVSVQPKAGSSWTKSDKAFRLSVTIPVNSRSEIYMPLSGGARSTATITENGSVIWKAGAFLKSVRGVTGGRSEGDSVVFAVGSGQYHFQSSP